MLNTALWLKARLFGTNRSAISTMEQRLFLTLYWRTAQRLPKAGYCALLRAFGRDVEYPVFINPYLEGSG